jgi:sulfate transport system ATP-binding protein
MSIEIDRISKRFGTFVALDDVSLGVATGELVALLGPSGSGKTSLLRIVAGLETPDSGRVAFHGADATSVDVRERNVGFVFQHYALFGHLTIFENVAFALRVRPRRLRLPEAEIARRVGSLLELVQLAFLADRFPHQLSGGQRQRVALVRALAAEPKVLLLDEPFGALDANVRHELRRWLRRLHDEVHVTSVFVTHDQEEALDVADRVVVMNHGRIEQVGAPDEVYEHPASAFVLSFLGQVNRWAADGDPPLYVRPHEIEVTRRPSPGALRARLARGAKLGPKARLEFATSEGTAIQVELPRERVDELALGCGDVAWLVPRRTRHFGGARR